MLFKEHSALATAFWARSRMADAGVDYPPEGALPEHMGTAAFEHRGSGPERIELGPRHALVSGQGFHIPSGSHY